ncbi:uncharacterized protein [Elaeis guineensis]|uniref:uncharacterized protein n=1 Tax=Elaeis guineensis var. tenera TaxID=51953 RepID=UPI003C6D20DD
MAPKRKRGVPMLDRLQAYSSSQSNHDEPQQQSFSAYNTQPHRQRSETTLSQPQSSDVADISSQSTSRRRGRGTAHGIEFWGTGQKVSLVFDAHMQPCGSNASKFKSQLGVIAKNGTYVPLTYASWTEIPQYILDHIWKEVQDNTDAPSEYRENCLRSVGEMWRNWKSYIKRHYYDEHQREENLISRPPPRVKADQ